VRFFSRLAREPENDILERRGHVVRIKQKVGKPYQKLFGSKMTRDLLDAYLRTHRRKAGLTQREMGSLLGYDDEDAVGRHERLKTLPPLLVALGYEVVFKMSVGKLFSGLKETVEKTIEPRILELEQKLQRDGAGHRRGSRNAKKLAWFSERRNIDDE
jgi:DNA-binding XRE family transcriptional regulator